MPSVSLRASLWHLLRGGGRRVGSGHARRWCNALESHSRRHPQTQCHCVPLMACQGERAKTPVPASNADQGLSRHLSGACCGALLWATHGGQKLRIWVEVTGRSPYCLQRAPATPMSLLRQRYAQPSGPRVRSALISTSVENLGSQRTPHFPPVWIDESGLYWRASAIIWRPVGGGSQTAAGGVRAGRALEGARCAKNLRYGWTSLDGMRSVCHKRSPRLGRCFGSETRTPAGRGSARLWSLPR